MTAMERLNRIAAGQIPDRVPVFCNLLDQGAIELDMSIRDYYSRGSHVAEGQLKMREKYGHDSLTSFFYCAMEAELLGCDRIIYAADGPPNVGQLVIREPADIDRLVIPEDLNEIPRFAELVACTKILKKESAGRYPVVSAVTASFSLPAMLMGMDAWMNLFLKGPERQRDALLEKCSLFCSRQIRALRAAGADLIAYGNPVASATFLTLKQFRDLALPWVRRDLEAAGTDGIVYFNGGGRINPLLQTLLDNTSLTAYYINPADDIATAKALLQGKALLAYAVNDIRLLDWSRDEICREVKRIMGQGKPGGNFAFGTLLMPYLIPEVNIRHLVEAARRYGSYADQITG